MNLILDRLQIQVDEPSHYITFFVKYLPLWLVFYKHEKYTKNSATVLWAETVVAEQRQRYGSKILVDWFPYLNLPKLV